MRFWIVCLATAGGLLIGYGLSRTSRAPDMDHFIGSVADMTKKVGRGFQYKMEQVTQEVSHKAELAKSAFSLEKDEKHSPNPTNDRETETIRRFHDLSICLESEEKPCPGFAEGSAREYYLDVLITQQDELLSYVNFLKSHPEKRSETTAAFARELLVENPHPEIQAAGLEILALYPPSEENLHAISEPMRQTLEADLLDRALEVLAPYKNVRGYSQQMTTILEDQIRIGIAEDTAETAAKALFRFMDDDSYRHFSEVRKRLREVAVNERYNSPIRNRYRALDSALREYESAHRLAN